MSTPPHSNVPTSTPNTWTPTVGPPPAPIHVQYVPVMMNGAYPASSSGPPMMFTNQAPQQFAAWQPAYPVQGPHNGQYVVPPHGFTVPGQAQYYQQSNMSPQFNQYWTTGQPLQHQYAPPPAPYQQPTQPEQLPFLEIPLLNQNLLQGPDYELYVVQGCPYPDPTKRREISRLRAEYLQYVQKDLERRFSVHPRRLSDREYRFYVKEQDGAQPPAGHRTYVRSCVRGLEYRDIVKRRAERQMADQNATISSFQRESSFLPAPESSRRNQLNRTFQPNTSYHPPPSTRRDLPTTSEGLEDLNARFGGLSMKKNSRQSEDDPRRQ